MRPEGERLEPLGASDDKKGEILPVKNPCHKCVSLEDERDVLQTSLFSLTTHLAQVQFRLKQIVDTPFHEQEELLKNLEEFAFGDVNYLSENITDDALVETMLKRRNHQKVLLEKLKCHLNELTGFDSLVCGTQRNNVESKIQNGGLEHIKCLFQKKRNFKDRIYEIVGRLFMVLPMLSLIQFWGSNCCTRSMNRWHWGDLRAKLELAIIDLTKMIRYKETQHKITLAVRKSLATSIRDLMQHGTKSNSFLSFVENSPQQTHSWDIIVYYYRFKKGDEYNSSTTRMLSRSFNLSLRNVSPQNNRRNLLCVIEEILSTHSRFKRSQDSHFKAFVCAGLNAKRLVSWLNLIFRCDHIIETFYHPWSYVACTRYEDGLRSLDVLKGYKFDLPVDLDVRKFQIGDNVFI